MEQQSAWKVCGEAENGREAIRIAEELRPHLIVLDLSMPVMNGLEAARILKQRQPEIPLVMWTMFAVDMVKHEAIAAGFSLVLCKSDGPHALITGITNLLAA